MFKFTRYKNSKIYQFNDVAIWVDKPNNSNCPDWGNWYALCSTHKFVFYIARPKETDSWYYISYLKTPVTKEKFYSELKSKKFNKSFEDKLV